MFGEPSLFRDSSATYGKFNVTTPLLTYTLYITIKNRLSLQQLFVAAYFELC